MLFINFGKWNSSHGKLFSIYRYYKYGWQWTPLVKVTFRYLKTLEA
jgi:hypothetical protein